MSNVKTYLLGKGWPLKITCWERADLLALVCAVFCEFVTFPLVSWVRCGTWLYRFLIFATILTLLYTESSHVACQIMGMEHRAPYKHIVCPYAHHRPLGGVKVYFTTCSFAAYQTKGMHLKAPCKHIFCPYIHPQLVTS